MTTWDTVSSNNLIHRFKKFHITSTSDGGGNDVLWKYGSMTQKRGSNDDKEACEECNIL